MALLSGCATPVQTYYPITNLNIAPKKVASTVEVTMERPSRSFVPLGEIALGGRPINTHQDLIAAAQQKGAEVGADFVWIYQTGSEAVNFYNPGFSSFAANRYNANGFSVGPSFGTRNLATMHALAGVYLSATIGLNTRVDKETKQIFVTGFSLKSKATEAGVKVGDQILGEDGIDVSDKALRNHNLTLRPGQKVKLSVLRDGVRKDLDVELVPN